MFRFRIGAAALLLSLVGSVARAQQATPGVARAPIDSLVARAQEVNPRVRAAAYEVEAARARVTPAGTLPDPVLAVGVMNLPISSPGFGDMMTMKTVGIDQTLPFPGKLAHAERAAALELEAAQTRLTVARLDVAADVRRAYYELAFLDHAFELLERSQHSFVELIEATEARYTVGTGTQQEVLQARVAAARRAEEAVAVVERRRAVLARLNALLDQPSAAPLSAPARVPERIARAAVGDGGAS